MKTTFALSLILFTTATVAVAETYVIQGFPQNIDLSDNNTAILTQELDIDKDGLLDQVSIQLKLKTSTPATAGIIDKNTPLQIDVGHVEYTLANGTCGSGHPQRISTLELEAPGRITINGKTSKTAEALHPIASKTCTLTLQGSGSTPQTIKSIGVEIKIDPTRPDIAGTSSPWMALQFLPLLLLFFRPHTQ
jgi:hypothetical protein